MSTYNTGASEAFVLPKLTWSLRELPPITGQTAPDNVVGDVATLPVPGGDVVECALTVFQRNAAVEALPGFDGKLDGTDNADDAKTAGLGVHRPGQPN